MARFEVGTTFDDYQTLEQQIKLYETEKFVSLYKKESRKIEAARKRCPDKNFKDELIYSELAFACCHNGKYKSTIVTGSRPNQKTSKLGCTMVIKLRATKDGQQLMVTSMMEEHNHTISEMAFKCHPAQRKMDDSTEDEVAKLCKLQAKRKLIQTFVKEETGKMITLKDIHNIATKTKLSVTTDSAVKDLADWLQSEHPAVDKEFILDENRVMIGLYLQDPEMKSIFNKFPEVILVDSTHKTNDRGMSLFVMMGIDGNGDSQVISCFILQQEDEGSLRQMVQVFKDRNPKWSDIKVVISDKDLTERTVFKTEMPQIDLQICLFHVLRTFGREITTEKMAITSAQRETVLDSITRLVYSKSVEDYQEKYDEFCSLCPNTNVKSYYDTNWHTIRSEWVEGLKCKQFNLKTRTNNRLESFFQKLKSVLPHKGNIKDLLSAFFGLLVTLRTERRYRSVAAASKVSTKTVSSDIISQFSELVTPYALQQIATQFEQSVTVKVCSDSTVETVHGIINVSSTSCECSTYSSMGLPCSHIFAILKHKDESQFCPDLVNHRWTKEYNNNFTSLSSPSRPIGISYFTPNKKTLGYNDKFRKASLITQQIATVLASCGTDLFEKRLKTVTEMLTYFKEDKDVLIVENLVIDQPQLEEHPIPSTSYVPIELPSTSAIPSVSIQSTLPSVAENETIDDITSDSLPDLPEIVTNLDSILEGATLPVKCKRRGRPKGAVKTAIGLPRVKRPAESNESETAPKRRKCTLAFRDKDSTSKHKHILSWYVSEEVIAKALSGEKIEKNCVETIPNNVPSNSLDDSIDINCVKRYFSEDAWLALLHIRSERNKLPWDCTKCHEDVNDGGKAICCESCLSWLHFKCARIRVQPKKKLWFCKECLNA